MKELCSKFFPFSPEEDGEGEEELHVKGGEQTETSSSFSPVHPPSAYASESSGGAALLLLCLIAQIECNKVAGEIIDNPVDRSNK